VPEVVAFNQRCPDRLLTSTVRRLPSAICQFQSVILRSRAGGVSKHVLAKAVERLEFAARPSRPAFVPSQDDAEWVARTVRKVYSLRE